MKVLVVHDRPDVTKELIDLLVSLKVERHMIDIAEDGVSVRSALQQKIYDLAIFDLTIPHIKGRFAADYSTAEQIFHELFYTESMNVPGDLIGLTKEADALGHINASIGPHLMAVVEETNDDRWKTLLKDRIEYATKSVRTRQRSINSRYDYDALVVTALDKEFAPYREIFELKEVPHTPGAYEFLFRDLKGQHRRGVSYSIGRAGQSAAASHTQALVSQFRPRLALMSGFCGGIKEKKVTIGQIIIAESIFDWDYGKWKGEGDKAVFVARPEPITIRDTKAHRLARRIVDEGLTDQLQVAERARVLSGDKINAVKLSLAPIASGSAVVADEEVIPRISSLNEDICGVDMEAYGFSFATTKTPVVKPEFIWVKTVADFCDRHKADTDHAACCYLSAMVVREILLKRWDFD